MAPKFIFLRHGEAEHNVAFHEVGESAFQDPKYQDAPLTEKGRGQARDVAQKLFELQILDVWTSPLTRCLQTCEELFEELNVGILYMHDNLLERQGQMCNKRASRRTLQKKYFIFNTEFLPDLPAEWVDKEPQLALLQRMRTFVLQLADMYKTIPDSYHILIVGHGDALSSLTGKAFKNCEFHVMRLEELPDVLKVGPA